jgi:hypothetical protein
MSSVDTITCTIEDSSSLRAMSYDIEEKILFVEFQTNACYIYKDVPLNDYLELITSEEIGKEFNKFKTRYKFEKVA